MTEQPLFLLKDISLSIIFAAFAAHIMRLLKQPPLLGYVFGGILLGGNLGIGLVTNAESIELISEIGLIFLLFIIGLEINLKELMRLGKAVFVLGIMQILISAALVAVCFSTSGQFGGGRFNILYLSVAMSLSSTLIVVKLLYDKFEIHTVAGQLTLGILVLQDVWAILFLAIQPTLMNPSFVGISRSLLLGVLLVIASFSISRFGLTRIFKAVAKTPELVVITAAAWCFAICFAAEFSGLSKEMGALIAGISIATFPYGAEVANKISGIRDFFVTLFFVSLGLKIPQPTWSMLTVSLYTTAIVIGTRLLSIIPMSVLMKKGIYTGTVTALNLSQISEFSLVIVSIGLKFGHVSHNIETVVLSSMLMASIISSYLIIFNHSIASMLTPLISRLIPGEKTSGQPSKEKTEQNQEIRDIVVLGCFREGRALLDEISRNAPELIHRVLVIDYNPDVGHFLEPAGFTWKYGDLSNPDSLKHLGIEKASVVICPISDLFLKGTTNMELVQDFRLIIPKAMFIMTAENTSMHDQLMQLGTFKVVIPGQITGNSIFKMLNEAIANQNLNA
ncbi:MAG: hypothetical protein A2283_02775 [Lentisphaerae bacterium RIFOXYA12_FULL_48_11]|nr:MAG: hypothetical protein A2283_02775 [Lentisphaerae bacterium RIFOXYA12_FULL_48_11]